MGQKTLKVTLSPPFSFTEDGTDKQGGFQDDIAEHNQRGVNHNMNKS